jgi:hypothetical protein
MRSYRIIGDSHADKFHKSRMKVRLFAGGFANGKTTGIVAETLMIAKDYPGAAILMARATYPKLNATLRREFIKWCPPAWIKSFDKSRDNTCVLKNGTIIDFRYIDQSKNEDGEGTSNLLSANYDFIVVDQIDDVQITHEDFLNLLGRLRGNAEYIGSDPTMPRTGPRMIVMSCNPTLGWPYKNLVKPVHDFRAGINNPNLICEVDEEGEPVLDANGRPIPLIEIFEASTYENAQNLANDYIKLLEATYRGKMRDRYLLGKWVAFDGIVYDEFDENLHVVNHDTLLKHIATERMQGARMRLLEGYDFGVTAPSCYLLSLVDSQGNVLLLDGFYKGSMGIRTQSEEMKSLRSLYYPEQVFLDPEMGISPILADPAIFKKSNASELTVGDSVAEMFNKQGIRMMRGNNNILNGIIKVKGYLTPQHNRLNPFTHRFGAPRFYVSHRLTWFIDEVNTYRWKKNRSDEAVDTPVDAKNHAMDSAKYMLSKEPAVAKWFVKRKYEIPNDVRKWHEVDDVEQDVRSHRYRA